MVNNIEIKHTKLFIDGEFVDGKLGKKFSTINPATEEEICKVSEATKEDVDLAVKAARRAFEEEWRSYAPYKRGELMNKWADLIERDIEIISKIECMDNGKPFNEVRNFDIPMVIRVIRYFAGWCDKICGKVIPVEGDYHVYTQREPVGVCGAIVPWNFPMYIASWKWSPCLAAGNTLILKSAEQTPLSVLYAAALAKEAGFPKGVFNVLSGYGETAGSAISHHMDIDKVSFTGSTEVGKLIQQASAKSNLKRVTLELGGKNPLIVLDDIKSREDMERVADTALAGLFFNQGEVCSASSLLYVSDKVHDDFVKVCKEKVEKRKVGDPLSTETEQGAQVSEEQFNIVLNYIKKGKEEGANLISGGKRHGDKGYFIEPTIFTNVKEEHTIAKEEIFGPVLCILPFSDVDEAIERANKTRYGLAAGVITNDLCKANRIARGLKSGTVYINTWNAVFPNVPFGGVKMSGFGKDLGENALENYTNAKSVITHIPGLTNPFPYPKL